MFGDFAPKRGDLVFSKTGEFLGLMDPGPLEPADVGAEHDPDARLQAVGEGPLMRGHRRINRCPW